MDDGKLNVAAELKIERQAGAAVTIDADQAPGPIAMAAAMDEAMAHDHGDMDHGMEPPPEYAGDGEGMPDGCPEDTGGETEAG